MAQGKIKVKTQMPSNVRGKKVKKLDKVTAKRKYIANPIGPKRAKQLEAAKLKKAISTTINNKLEEQLVAQIAQDGKSMNLLGRKSKGAVKPSTSTQKNQAAKGKAKK